MGVQEKISAFTRLSLVWAPRKRFPPGLIKRLNQRRKGAGQAQVDGKIQRVV